MPQLPAPNQPLASTAHWTAAVRALETARADRLLDDPWAALLAGEEGEAWITGRSPASVVPIVLRTRFFDDFLQRVSAQDRTQQVVLVAAGLDTRAFRLPWPEGTQLFELDRPAILQAKNQILREAGAVPACQRHIIGTDLTAPWQEALVGAGFAPDQPSLWLLEGFLFYLPSDSITRLLDGVTGLAAPGSWLGFDVVNSAALTSPLTQAWIEMQARLGAPWIGVMDDPEGFLASRGWQATLTQAGQPDANHARWPFPIIPTKMPDMPHNWFVIAQKIAENP